MEFIFEQNMYHLKGKQPQQYKPFLLIDIRKYILSRYNLVIAYLYFPFDNMSIHIAQSKKMKDIMSGLNRLLENAKSKKITYRF